MWLRDVRISVPKVQKDQQNPKVTSGFSEKKDPLCFSSQETSLHEFNLLKPSPPSGPMKQVGYQFQTQTRGFHEWGE
jgi:hypothetical protein